MQESDINMQRCGGRNCGPAIAAWFVRWLSFFLGLHWEKCFFERARGGIRIFHGPPSLFTCLSYLQVKFETAICLVRYVRVEYDCRCDFLGSLFSGGRRFEIFPMRCGELFNINALLSFCSSTDLREIQTWYKISNYRF